MKKTRNMLVLVFLIACSNPQRPTFKTGLEGNSMPSFTLLLIDSVTKFNTDEIIAKKAVVLFCFSPSCPYCRAQTEDILANIDSLKNIQFCLLTAAPFSEFKNFYKEYNLEKYSNIIVGIDIYNHFGEYFKVTGVPYTAIYNQQQILTQVIVGRAKTRDIVELTLK